MKTLLLFTASLMLLKSTSFAQCAAPTAMDTLNINEVSALILNGGNMHFNPITQMPAYEVPKGSGLNSIYASGLWIGGKDQGGQLRMAAQTYGNGTGLNDFWPGPLDTTNATTDSITCSQYDKIWKISRYKVEEFKYEWALGNVQNNTYTPDPDILSWPGNGNTSLGQAHYLAPFVDVNSNGIYDPLTGGDYPKIKGDQMLWWVFNDRGDIHTNTGGSPLGVEIRASAYAYTCPQIADSLKILNYTTLYHYEIINRSTHQLDSTYLGYWQDGDLGNYQDDYVGCNPQESYGYIYNGDNNDDGNYGLNPPILSTILLQNHSLSSFAYYTNGGALPMQDPSNAVEYYHYLNGRWRDGTPFTYGASGYGGVTPTNFIYPDFPYNSSGWSEKTVNNMPNDRRFLMSSGPFTFFPGAKVDLDFAIVWTRDTTLPYGSQASFDKNLKDNLKIKHWFATDSFPSCLQLNLAVNEEGQNANNIALSPNPSSDFILVNYQSRAKKSVFEVIDITGRILSIHDQSSTIQRIDVSHLPQGLYLLKVKDGDLHFAKRFIKN